MSRIGKNPIALPAGVTFAVDGLTVKVKGPKGELALDVPETISVSQEDSTLTVVRADESKATRSLHGTIRARIANMVTGVSTGFERNLDIIGVGYSAELSGEKLVMKLGFSHVCEFVAPAGIEIEVPAPTRIVIKGIDKQQVGQIAADVRAHRPPEPYKGKGIRYHDEHVRRKAGKLAASSGA